jgi:hypothetical protein
MSNIKILKLGKNYKNIKLNFIKSFGEFILLEQNNDEVQIIKFIEKIRLSLFDYLEPFMIIDAHDMINIIYKKYELKNGFQLFNYIENIFNNDLYKILIEHIVKKKYVDDKADDYVKLLTRNILMYFGIIKIEILKIKIIKKITMSKEDNHVNINNVTFTEIYNQFLKDMINNSKKIILQYYNDLKKNYSICNEIINNCKEIIIKNNILVKC